MQARALHHFNSHAHVERDLSVIVVTSRQFISTHTLTWSVTVYASSDMLLFVISTHTLTWSVTGTAFTPVMAGAISTHTLTWSVTA